MKKLSLDNFIRLRKLVHRSARPIDFTKWNYLFENGSCEDFLTVLSSYQNEDGGFGHNIECNNWNPNSSPYTVCIALDYLDTACDYVSSKKDKIVKGINSGQRPRIGDILAENITKEEAIDLAKRCLEYYAANAKKRERTARFIERIGIDEFKKAVKLKSN